MDNEQRFEGVAEEVEASPVDELSPPTRVPRVKKRFVPKRKPVKKRGALIQTEPTPVNQPPASRSATEPWKPATLLQSHKRPGFRPRFCRIDTLDKRIAEGWSPVQGKNTGKAAQLIDGTQLTNLIQVRGLVLCEIPEELAQSREAYFSNLTDGALGADVKEFQQGVKRTGLGAETYGTININRG